MVWVTVAGSFIAEFAAKKLLDSLCAKAPRVFSESFSQLPGKPIADRYLALSGSQLLEFYAKETPVSHELLDESFLLPVCMALEAVNDGSFDTQGVTFSLTSSCFDPPAEIDAYVGPIKARAQADKRYHNGKCVRLLDLAPSHDSGIRTRVSLCGAHYHDSLATNFAMDHRPKGRTESLREYLHGRDRVLGGFRESALVNHIGMVCMLETADGMLVAQHRSTEVANRGRTLSSSVSGAVDYSDLRPHADQGDFGLNVFAEAVLRKGFEELGIEPRDIRFLGLVRELLRGGKPELYFYARSSESLVQIVSSHRQSASRTESKSIKGFEFHSSRVTAVDSTKFAFYKRVHDILSTAGDLANLTFILGAMLTARHVLKNVDQKP